MLKESNYWLSGLQPQTFPAHDLPAKVDVVVIGAGFSGLSAALTLAQAGSSVAVLEAETIGWGASCRNGGMVLTGMKLGVETLISKYGRERARRMFALSLAAIQSVEDIVNAENIDCDFSRCGHYEAAWKPAHYEAYARAADLMNKEFGHSVRIIPRAEQRTEIGSDLYHGGMLDEISAGVDPARFVRGLARAAEKAGVGLYEHTLVQNVERQGTGFIIHTSRGDISSQMVFVGTSGYTGKPVGWLQRRIVPIGSYIIATEPLSAELAREVVPNDRMIFDSKNYLYYFRLTPDRRMLFGGRAVFKPETDSSVRESAPLMRQAMINVYPQLKDIQVEYVWGGSLDIALDSMPHTGQTGGIHYSLGYAGHGVAFATHLGRLVAQQMLGGQVENPLDGLPFQAFPLYGGNPWFLPLAGWYYRALDIIS